MSSRSALFSWCARVQQTDNDDQNSSLVERVSTRARAGLARRPRRRAAAAAGGYAGERFFTQLFEHVEGHLPTSRWQVEPMLKTDEEGPLGSHACIISVVSGSIYIACSIFLLISFSFLNLFAAKKCLITNLRIFFSIRQGNADAYKARTLAPMNTRTQTLPLRIPSKTRLTHSSRRDWRSYHRRFSINGNIIYHWNHKVDYGISAPTVSWTHDLRFYLGSCNHAVSPQIKGIECRTN